MLNARLAIVEDEAPLREDLIAFFQLKGVKVFGYATAEGFFVALKKLSFDLVILDIGLPGLSGIEASKLIHKKTNTSILILTSHSNHKTHIESLNAGADVFLSKSAPLEIVESSVRNMLLRRQVANGASSSISNLSSANTDQAAWSLHIKNGILVAPNHMECLLTYTETQFLSSLLSDAEQTVSRVNMLKAMGKDETLSNLRNLDTYANRIRRKVFDATNVDIPIRSAYSLGYYFSGDGHVLP